MTLANYWPLQAEVDNCIRTEAETVDEAVLLAVHQTTRIVHRSEAGAVEEEKSEQDLLDALLRDSADGSAVVVSLTGPSGVGKSHMVRWLHAQLQRHERRGQMVVILVPKTASLRRVVELILEPLQGAEYDELRTSLSTAIASISKEDAPARLATELGLQLKRKANEWLAALDSNFDRALKPRAYHAQKLQVFLSDPIFREGMLNAALERIVSRAVSGDTTGSQQLPQFEVDDFDWKSPDSFTDATIPAQEYFKRLNDHEGHSKAIAVDVLNSVIDPAMRMVFRFAQALGGRTIEEIVDAIRVQLLQEGKELILLIEDFAALSGIQEPLLSMIIAENEHGSGSQRAPIRTALAVTDGFMPQRATILTRARGEWVIASEYGNDEVLFDRLAEMAGRYLNAARWGRKALRAQFEHRSDLSATGLYGWIRPYADDNLEACDAERLSAFGQTDGGYPLFPLNSLALRSLAARELRSGGKLVFNPRAFINRVLRETLSQRRWYEQDAFPPAGFKPGILPSGTDTDLDGMIHPAPVKARLKTMLVHWCGNPATLRGAAPVDAAVFDAFGLPFPFVVKGPVKPPDKKHAKEDGNRTVTPPPPSPPPPPPRATSFEKDVELWSSTSKPRQATARRARVLVGEGVARRLGLDSTMQKKITDSIWLPYVDHGNPQTSPMFQFAEQTSEVAGWVRLALIGLDRYDIAKGWDFPVAEDFFGHSQRLLDEVTLQVERYMKDVGQSRLTTAMHVAYRQNLMLGISVSRTMPTVLTKIFEAAPAGFNEADFSALGEIDRAAALGRALTRTRRMRVQLQNLILSEAACFQGSGDTVLALDYARVAAAWAGKADDTHLRQSADQELKEHLSELGNGLGGYVKIAGYYSDVLSKHGDYLMAVLGDELDKDAWLGSVRQTLQLAQTQGFMPYDFDDKRDFSRLEQLGRAALTELVRSVQQALVVCEEKEPEERMRAYGRVDVGLLLRSTGEIRRLEALLDGIGRNLVGAEHQAQRDVVGEVRSGFIYELQTAALMLTGDAK